MGGRLEQKVKMASYVHPERSSASICAFHLSDGRALGVQEDELLSKVGTQSLF